MQILYMTDHYASGLGTRPVKIVQTRSRHTRVYEAQAWAHFGDWIRFATLTTYFSDMATKRLPSASVSASQAPPKKTKRQVTVNLQEVADKPRARTPDAFLAALQCRRTRQITRGCCGAVCRHFDERIRGMKNFSNV